MPLDRDGYIDPRQGMPSSTEEMLGRMVNRDMYNNEAQYRAQTELFRRWLRMTYIAMQQESIAADHAERVLNRMVFGHPSGADAMIRMDTHEQMVRMAEMSVPQAKYMLHDIKCPARSGGDCVCGLRARA